MTRTSESPRDRAIANEVGYDRALMCTAVGCPNRWSCDVGRGRLCSWHDRAEPHHWPRITQEQLDAETDRALRNAAPPAPGPRIDPRVARAKLREQVPLIGRRAGDKAWAYRLQQRDRRGEFLTPAVREMYRRALGIVDGGGAVLPVQPELVDEARTTPVGGAPRVEAPALRSLAEPDFDGRDVPIEAYEDAR